MDIFFFDIHSNLLLFIFNRVFICLFQLQNTNTQMPLALFLLAAYPNRLWRKFNFIYLSIRVCALIFVASNNTCIQSTNGCIAFFFFSVSWFLLYCSCLWFLFFFCRWPSCLTLEFVGYMVFSLQKSLFLIVCLIVANPLSEKTQIGSHSN